MNDSCIVGYSIYDTCLGGRVIKVSGDVGLEVEVEGNKFYKDNSGGLIPKSWKYTKDGSLRGEDNAEYVLKKPISFKNVSKEVDKLWEFFDDYGSVLDESNRTSIHVHLNAQDWYAGRISAFLAMYFALEEILTSWCGDHRIGNLFCLRAKDAEAIITKCKDFIRTDFRSPLSNGLHYSGLNLSAILKFGSIEIRALRGVTNKETLKTWVNILKTLYDKSAQFENDPRLVVEGFSGEGPMSFLHNILGDYTQEVVQGCQMNEQQIIESLYEGIRYAQEIAYCRDWDKYRKGSDKPDPFRRAKKATLLEAYAQAAGLHNPFPNTAPSYPSAPTPVQSYVAEMEEFLNLGEEF